MRIEVTGRQIDVGAALREHVEHKLRDAVEKYAVRPVEAQVIISREAHLYECVCIAHLSTGLTAQASAKADDVYPVCDQAIARLEKQLRRHKRRLRDHHQRRKEPVEATTAASYVLAPQTDAEEDSGDSAQQDDLWAPVVVAEGVESVPALSVGEAVMQLELKHSDVLLFKNEMNSRLNAVYRRDDGHIGWIDPAEDGR